MPIAEAAPMRQNHSNRPEGHAKSRCPWASRRREMALKLHLVPGRTWQVLLATLPAVLSISLWVAAGFVGENPRLLLVYSAGVLTSLAGAMLGITLTDRRRRQGPEASGEKGFEPNWRDSLTGLLTRTGFEHQMKHAVAGARRHRRTLGILCVDLDGFKRVNDTLGHPIGDRLLRDVASRLVGCLREDDVVARSGGDEFLVGLPEIRDRQDAAAVASKVAETLRASFQIEGHQLAATAAIGVSLFPEDGHDVETLCANADRAMHCARAAGGDGFSCYSAGLGELAKDRLELEQHLSSALANGELVLYYQPQYNLQTRKLVALEALLRWRHPERGLLRPSHFLGLAEDSGQILNIGSWVLETVCREIRNVLDAGYGGVRFAVNVSPRQFVRPGFEDFVLRTIQRARIDPKLLELDLPETLVMRDFNNSRARIDRLRKMGVRVALDDFGSGTSSLGDLRNLTVDCLKIDGSLIHGLGGDAKSAQFVESVVGLARSLGICAVAEGVESIPQLRALRAAGCEVAQGYLLGMPRPANEVLRLVSGAPVSGCAQFRAVYPRAQNPMWSAGHTIQPVDVPSPLATKTMEAGLTVAAGGTAPRASVRETSPTLTTAE
jgi:diguanylate cyclase (GGDEF)-like protein